MEICYLFSHMCICFLVSCSSLSSDLIKIQTYISETRNLQVFYLSCVASPSLSHEADFQILVVGLSDSIKLYASEFLMVTNIMKASSESHTLVSSEIIYSHHKFCTIYLQNNNVPLGFPNWTYPQCLRNSCHHHLISTVQSLRIINQSCAVASLRGNFICGLQTRVCFGVHLSWYSGLKTCPVFMNSWILCYQKLI